MAKCPESSRTDDFAELKRQLDVAYADIALANERLDAAQGMQFLGRHLVRGTLCQYLTMCVLDVDGVAAVENLRAGLARAKEQARESDAAACQNP